MTIEEMRAEFEKHLIEGEIVEGPTTDWVRTKLDELQAGEKPVGGILRIVHGDYTEQLTEENVAEIRKAIADGEDMYAMLEKYVDDSHGDYEVYLDGVQIHSTY